MVVTFIRGRGFGNSRFWLGIALTAGLFGGHPVRAVQPAKANGPLIEPVSIIRLQEEPEDPAKGRYDWGPSVMRDGDLHKMWFVRLGGGNKKRFPYAAVLPDGERFEFTYPDWGDRIYYAESRDGRSWHLAGEDYDGPVDRFGPDAPGPLMALQPAESPQERHHLGDPSVIKVDGTYYLYYETCSEYVVKRDATGKIIVGDEYHNQVFVATSKDGRTWKKHPDDANPQPIVAAPASNKEGRRRYGLGQPSVFFRDGKYVMHYVDSCTGPADSMVRIEADDPFFTQPRVFGRRLQPPKDWPALPAGAVARFAQTDIKPLGQVLLLARPAYETGNLNLMASRTGLFNADAAVGRPADVFPQLVLTDPRGKQYRTRLFPRFLCEPHGQVLIEDGKLTIYYTSGLGFKDKAYTWDLFRCDVALDAIEKACRVRLGK